MKGAKSNSRVWLFLLFFKYEQMQQDLWALDLGLSFSDNVAMFKLLQFSTAGRLNPRTHYFDVPLSRGGDKKHKRRK